MTYHFISYRMDKIKLKTLLVQMWRIGTHTHSCCSEYNMVKLSSSHMRYRVSIKPRNSTSSYTSKRNKHTHTHTHTHIHTETCTWIIMAKEYKESKCPSTKKRIFEIWHIGIMGFPGGSDSKESACNMGDLGSIPGLRRSPGGGHGIIQI